MRKMLLAAAALASTTPLIAQKVSVADGNWSDYPVLSGKRQVELSDKAMEMIDDLVAEGKCRAIKNRRGINLNLPFIAKYDLSGAFKQLVVKRIGCPEVEKLAASAALYAAETGEFTTGSGNQAGWYLGNVSYVLEP